MFCYSLDLGWIQKHQDQLQSFITPSFLGEILNHMRNLDVLSSAEEAKVKEEGRLQDQVNMLTTIVTAKDSQASDVLQGFIESSDSQVAQLIINHGKRLLLSVLCNSLKWSWGVVAQATSLEERNCKENKSIK